MYYRTDLIDKLLADAGWKARYEEISEKQLGKKLDPEGPRPMDLGRLGGDRAVLHEGDQSRQPDALRNRAADEEPPVQHDGLAFDRAVRGRRLDGRQRQDHGELAGLPDGARALQETLRRRRLAEGFDDLRICRGQRRLRLRPGGDDAAMECGFRRSRQQGQDPRGRRQDRRGRAARRPGRAFHAYPRPWPRSQQGLGAQGRRIEVHRLARHRRRDGDLCQSRRFAGIDRRTHRQARLRASRSRQARPIRRQIRLRDEWRRGGQGAAGL